MTCDSLQSYRDNQLPDFTQAMAQNFSVSIEWLYAENYKVDKSTSAGIDKWLSNAITLYKRLEYEGRPTPSGFHFDVEYASGHSADAIAGAEAVLAFAARARAAIDGATFVNRPTLAWDVQDAASTTYASCPDGTNRTIAACFFKYMDYVVAMTYRSFAVEYMPPHDYCDGIVPQAAQFFELAQQEAADSGRFVGITMGVETVCDISWNPTTNEKTSFCAKYHSKYAGGTATDWMVDTLTNATKFLGDTTLARETYPCAAAQIDLPLPSGQNYLKHRQKSVPMFAVHSFAGLSKLAYDADIYGNCPVIPPQPHEVCT